MNIARNLQLPLIITSEKEELLGSILQMLRGEGFAIVPVEENEVFPHTHSDEAVELMDGLSILRYIREYASKDMLVRIMNTENPAVLSEARFAIAA